MKFGGHSIVQMRCPDNLHLRPSSGLAVRYLGGSAGARPARGEVSEHNREERSVLDTSIVRRKEHAYALFSQRPVPNQRTI